MWDVGRDWTKIHMDEDSVGVRTGGVGTREVAEGGTY